MSETNLSNEINMEELNSSFTPNLHHLDSLVPIAIKNSKKAFIATDGLLLVVFQRSLKHKYEAYVNLSRGFL